MKHAIPAIHQKHALRASKPTDGFTMVEAVVAGVLLAVVMGSVSRLSVSALASSSNQSERVRIEAAINDNIQLLQMEDSYLRLEDMASQGEQDAACSSPTSHLKTHLEARVPAPDPPKVSKPIERSFEILDDSGMDILIAKYKFFAPEHKGKSDALERWEYRTVELNPNFSAQCYTTVS
jgi:type II secretory pathway pseudopilin PulG